MILAFESLTSSTVSTRLCFFVLYTRNATYPMMISKNIIPSILSITFPVNANTKNRRKAKP